MHASFHVLALVAAAAGAAATEDDSAGSSRVDEALSLLQSQATIVRTGRAEATVGETSEQQLGKEHSSAVSKPCDGGVKMRNWSDLKIWRERIGFPSSNESEGSKLAVWNALQSANLDWMLFLDGWAIARKGKSAFQGTLCSKNGDEGAEGDFLGVATEVLQRMQSISFEEKVTAKDFESVIAPLSSGCHSELNPYVKNKETFQVCYRGTMANCTVSSMDHSVLSKMKREMDSELYDIEQLSIRDVKADRMPILQRYLDDYYASVEKTDNLKTKVRALAKFGFHYARLHVFCDGNGRMRHLFVTRELVRFGLHPALLFDYNKEMFHLTRDDYFAQIVEGLWMWEKAVKHRCVPWTPYTVKTHLDRFGPKHLGLSAQCTADYWDQLGMEYGCKELQQ